MFKIIRPLAPLILLMEASRKLLMNIEYWILVLNLV